MSRSGRQYAPRPRRLYAQARRVAARVRRKNPDPAVVAAEQQRLAVRLELAKRYLEGSGIEIGALNSALPLPAGVSVRYVDRMSLEGLRAQYPELEDWPFVAPDVIDDGETLETFADGTLDFVIANHFIEHCQNPIKTLENALRVLREGGVTYMAVPDKRAMFDSERPVTTLEHLVRDYDEGPEWSREEHFREFARLVDHAHRPEDRARELMERDFSIHYHVWTPEAFATLLDHCRSTLGFPFEVVEVRPNGVEFIAILRRTRRGADA